MQHLASKSPLRRALIAAGPPRDCGADPNPDDGTRRERPSSRAIKRRSVVRGVAGRALLENAGVRKARLRTPRRRTLTPSRPAPDALVALIAGEVSSAPLGAARRRRPLELHTG